MHPGRISVGTSGFSYPDWVGPVYPPGTPRRRMLEAYAALFPIVEINATYYALPGRAAFASLAERTPPHFRFTVKLPAALTHRAAWEKRALPDQPSCEEAAAAFLAALAPLVASGKLAALLAQFPESFRPGREATAHLERLAALLPADPPLAVEVRHRDWLAAGLFDLLRGLRFAYVAVDEPDLPGLVPPVMAVTAACAYLRLHSRDASRWYAGAKARYDYLYTEHELAGWVPQLREAAEETEEVFVFFNNCHHGQAAANARALLALLGLEAPSFGTLF
jgi:uncharacterized protein YecE (DUF72 family)